MKKAKKLKQICALVLVMAFCLTAVFSFSGLIVSAHHNCTGPHCTVCERAMFIKITLSFTAVPLLIFTAIKTELNRREEFMIAEELPGCTGVRLKTRLNN